jgi:hypothetical protein
MRNESWRGRSAYPLFLDLPVAQYHEFLRGQTFEADWPAGMQPVRANPDLRAQAVFEAVSEAGGSIDYH